MIMKPRPRPRQDKKTILYTAGVTKVSANMCLPTFPVPRPADSARSILPSAVWLDVCREVSRRAGLIALGTWTPALHWRQNQSLRAAALENFVAEAPRNTSTGNCPAWLETVYLSYLIAAMALVRLACSIISFPSFVLRG